MSKRKHGRQQLEHERQRRRRKRMPHLPAHQNRQESSGLYYES